MRFLQGSFMAFVIVVGFVESSDNFTKDGRFYKTRQKLRAIPTDIPKQASMVFLYGNYITNVSMNSFENNTVCLNLDLSENRILYIDTGAFNGLKNLVNLSLERNDLTEIRADMWVGLDSLKGLYLGSNKISNIEPYCFQQQRNLEILSLQSNTLTKVEPDRFLGPHNLQELHLCCNRIETVSFGNLKNLVTIDLYYNEIKTLSSGFLAGLFSLKTADFSANSITHVEAGAFSNLTNLETLKLDINKFKKLSTDVFNFEDFPASDGHPPKLSLTLSKSLVCDPGLCWIQLAWEEGWLKLSSAETCILNPDDRYGPFKYFIPSSQVLPQAVLNCSGFQEEEMAPKAFETVTQTPSASNTKNTENTKNIGIYVVIAVASCVFVGLVTVVVIVKYKRLSCRKMQLEPFEVNTVYDQHGIYAEIKEIRRKFCWKCC